MSRTYDLVIFGATGFTGSLVCEYLVQSSNKDVRWAIAGRNSKKLQDVKAKLVELDSECESRVDILIGDSGDRESLDRIVRQTRVVLSTVGPFTKYGGPLVEACVENKTHYIDSTGEYNFVKSLIDKHHEKARQEGTFIVPCCGFDSIPSDLGTFMVCDYIRKKHNIGIENVKCSVVSFEGGLSGGTYQSFVEVMGDDNISLMQSLDPYLLSPMRGKDSIPSIMMRRDKDFDKRWQTFWAMAPTNERIVRRTWALLAERGEGYGPAFRYHETLSMKFFSAFAFTTVMVLLGPLIIPLLRMRLTRNRVAKLLPTSGEGPTREEIENSTWEVQLVATSEKGSSNQSVRVRGTVKGFKHGGYGDTARMLIESALCLVKDHDMLPAKEGGVLTTASAFGNVLLERLRADGKMIFETEELPSKGQRQSHL